jgi:MoxR-like ATPase
MADHKITPVLDKILELKSLVDQSIIGQVHVVDRLLIGLLAGGNILLP